MLLIAALIACVSIAVPALADKASPAPAPTPTPVSGSTKPIPASFDTTAFETDQSISSFGRPNTQTYGQTITATKGQLRGGSFRVTNIPSTTIMRFEVYEWDPTLFRATGPALFESAPLSTTGTARQTISFSIPTPVTLLSGHQYVVFVTTSRDAQPDAMGRFLSADDTAYPGGRFVYINNGTDTSMWTSSRWLSLARDLIFSLQIS